MNQPGCKDIEVYNCGFKNIGEDGVTVIDSKNIEIHHCVIHQFIEIDIIDLHCDYIQCRSITSETLCRDINIHHVTVIHHAPVPNHIQGITSFGGGQAISVENFTVEDCDITIFGSSHGIAVERCMNAIIRRNIIRRSPNDTWSNPHISQTSTSFGDLVICDNDVFGTSGPGRGPCT